MPVRGDALPYEDVAKAVYEKAWSAPRRDGDGAAVATDVYSATGFRLSPPEKRDEKKKRRVALPETEPRSEFLLPVRRPVAQARHGVVYHAHVPHW